MGIDHDYEPDFIVCLANALFLLLEIKGYEFRNVEQVNAKHNAARRWVMAVNNQGEFGQWGFLECRDLDDLLPQLKKCGMSAPPAPPSLAKANAQVTKA